MYLFYMGENPKKVLLSVSESDLRQDEIEAISDRGHFIKYNPKINAWEMEVKLADSNIKELSHFGEISVSQKVIDAMRTYRDSLSELVISPRRIRFNQDYLTYPHLIGKGVQVNFQIEDLLRGLNQNRFAYAHDTGLGKSWTMTALMGHLYMLGRVKRFIVCSSNIGVGNVAKEIVTHSKVFKESDIVVYNAVVDLPKKSRFIFDKGVVDQKIIVCSYDVIKAVGFAYYDRVHATKKEPHPSAITSIRNVPWDDEVNEWFGVNEGYKGCFMADEFHTVNIATSKRTSLCKNIFRLCDYRYLFSGTIADKVEKLYMVASILDPYLTGGLGYKEWLTVHNNLGNKISDYAVNESAWDTEYLAWLNQQLVTTYGAKRDFDECMDTEAAIRHAPIQVEMTPEHREIYESASNETLSMYQSQAEAKGKTLSMVATSSNFQTMHMAVDNPACLVNSTLSAYFTPELNLKIQKFYENGIQGLAKWKTLLSIMENHYFKPDGEKGIIWCYHPATREMIVKGLEDLGVKVFSLSKEMVSKERKPYIDTFLNYPEKAVFVAPITLVNSSVTMVQCTWEFYFEKVYSYKDYKQSLGRIHRATKTKVSNTYSALYNRSIDYLQESTLQQKGNLLNSLMNTRFITSDKWRELFNLNNVVNSL